MLVEQTGSQEVCYLTHFLDCLWPERLCAADPENMPQYLFSADYNYIYIYILKHQWRMDRMIVDAHPNLQFSKSFYHRSKMRCLEGEITPYMSDFGSFNMKVPDCPYRLNPLSEYLGSYLLCH